jgi:hypothetical protein
VLLLLLLPPAHVLCAGTLPSSSLRHTLKLSAVYLTAMPLAISTANTASAPFSQCNLSCAVPLAPVGAKFTVNLQIL